MLNCLEPKHEDLTETVEHFTKYFCFSGTLIGKVLHEQLSFGQFGEEKTVQKTSSHCSWSSGINHYSLRETHLFLNQPIQGLL